ncbi:MCE family protein [Smaragdicoccus niigatensis]|uniref:MCE family protein n=1 Tax=Smaragdicoccus niigatensis TaxID=359359 RepID=UPI00058B9C3D|nr:MCE family protein [Smaragdicoccus niigatensis]
MNTRLTTLARVAAVGVLSLAAASCSALPDSANAALTGQNLYSADFSNVAGMYEGNEVDVLGVPVGEIQKVTPMGTFVRVEFSVDKSVKLPKDAMAALISPGIVTNRHVELVPAYSGDGPTLEPGAHLPLSRTRTPIELEEVLNTLDRIGKDLQGTAGKDQLGPLSGRVAYNVLNGQGDHLREIIDNLSKSLKVGIDNKDAVGNIIVNLNELTQIVAENDSSVRDLSKNLTKLTNLLAEQSPGLEATLNQVNAFLKNTSTVLEAHRPQLKESLVNLTSVSQQLQDNARKLTETIDVLPLTMQNLGNAVSVQDRSTRIHLNLDKEILDGEHIAVFCQRILMHADGCRTGRLKDFGPDFGITEAMLGVVNLK